MAEKADLSQKAQLRVLATSDLHVHIYPYDYYGDRPTDRVGLARTASLISQARAEVGNCLLFDNGDFIQGNPLGDLMAETWSLRKGQVHPMISAMNHLAYDGATLGNHEFDHGLDLLSDVVGQARFPIVCANLTAVTGARKGESLMAKVRPWIILERTIAMTDGQERRLKLGLTGVVPPQVRHWAEAHMAGQIKVADMVSATRTAVEELRLAGADLVLLLAHSGIGPDEGQTGMENAATVLAGLSGVDAVVAGHSHLAFPDPSHPEGPGRDSLTGQLMGKPAVMPGFWGSHLGVIDLDLALTAERWSVTGFRSHLRPICQQISAGEAKATVESLGEILDLTKADHLATLNYIRRPVGQSAVPLNSFFALVTETAATRIIAEAQAAHVRQALRNSRWSGLPILSATAPYKAGGRGGPDYFTDVQAGDLVIRHLADLYLYPNTIRALHLKGAEVADWLEHSMGIYRQIIPGQDDQPLIDPDFPSYNFDTMTGLTYAIDLSAPRRFDKAGQLIDPSAHRLKDLRWNGAALDPQQDFVVVTNSYRAAGGGEFPGLPDPSRIIHDSPLAVRDILLRHVLMQGAVMGLDRSAWHFRPMPMTSVLFDSAPQATEHLKETAFLKLESMGMTAQGFARFRLKL